MTIPSGVVTATDVNNAFLAIYNAIVASSQAGVVFQTDLVWHNSNAAGPGSTEIKFTPPDDMQVVGYHIRSLGSAAYTATFRLQEVTDTSFEILIERAVSTVLTTYVETRQDMRTSGQLFLRKGRSYFLSVSGTNNMQEAIVSLFMVSRRRKA